MHLTPPIPAGPGRWRCRISCLFHAGGVYSWGWRLALSEGGSSLPPAHWNVVCPVPFGRTSKLFSCQGRPIHFLKCCWNLSILSSLTRLSFYYYKLTATLYHPSSKRLRCTWIFKCNHWTEHGMTREENDQATKDSAILGLLNIAQ